MSTRIRLARAGSKNRPFFRIVVSDKRSPRDGKFIEKLGTYNPLLPKEDENRVLFDEERVKYWLSKGATPSYKMAIFLSKSNLVEKPPIPEQTKKHLPKVKKKEGKEDKKEPVKQAEAPKADAKPEEKPQEEAPKADAKPEEKPQEEAPKADAKPEEKPQEEVKSENTSDKKD
jgi:small subunit ribosomal protein S16